ncbi:hypothetical protein [Taibaiella koreensis]|uniref:hypothetical protein n=1 Tax=Taibaiella koreensis TaxID=1268548 RepID=UPI000E59C46D|nr:hypothetical protein [Taibaiella koreensis]
MSKVSPDDVGAIFAEGDSSYVRRVYTNGQDTSLIYHYFGKERNRGILFIFTRNKALKIKLNEFKMYLAKRKKGQKALFKVDDQPLSTIYNSTNKISSIRRVENFPLVYWETGRKDIFVLFIIKTRSE